jgi:ribulose-phosphate 3-epimerase
VPIRIHPSILSADFVNMESELRRIDTADAVHVDVMDNHFVNALTFGPQMVKRIQEVSPVPLDVHLMIENPDLHAPVYAEIGAASVTFHVEAARDSLATIYAIKAAGAQAAIALKPGTALEPYFDLLHVVDMVLIMTVEPGAGGQPFMMEMMPKLESLATYLSDNNLSVAVEVDGGITRETLPIAFRSGADTFVAGSSVYGHGDPNSNIHALRHTIPEGDTL